MAAGILLPDITTGGAVRANQVAETLVVVVTVRLALGTAAAQVQFRFAEIGVAWIATIRRSSAFPTHTSASTAVGFFIVALQPTHALAVQLLAVVWATSVYPCV